MTRNIRVTIIIVSVTLLISAVSFRYIKKFCATKEATRFYLEGLKPIKNKDNPFSPEAQLAFYDSLELLPGNDVRRAMVISFFKSASLLKLGQEKKAIEFLGHIVERAKDNRMDQLGVEAKKSLALAYLRLGERNNCIAGHNSGSCIFPIRDRGIYMDPAASQKGIGLYQELLQQDPGDQESRWLLNLAYMTIGAYPDKVPSAWLITGLDKDTSAYSIKPFQDMSGALGLNNFRSQAGGSIVDDFNNDGYLDIITSSWDLEEPMHYFRNNGDGSFTDVSKESGLSSIKGGLNIIEADYNNDGFKDILVLRGAWLQEFGRQPKTLLRNNGDGTFTDVTVESGILSFNPTQTATWADFNNDGWLDLFIGHETTSPEHPHPSELYINNQDGTFTEVAAEAGCREIAFMKGVTSSDYDRDGWPDIFISCRDGRKMLLKNKGIKSRIPQFEDVTHAAGLDREMTFTFPAWFWDYDNDGWPDIFTCGYRFQGSLACTAAAEALRQPLPLNTSRMYLYRNNHDGTFTDVSAAVGLDRPVFAMGANFGDLDNDGWLDMYLGTGNPDYASLVPNRMFKNIEGGSFGGNPFRKNIGIGTADKIDELTVKWPTSGISQVFKDVAPRQFLKIREGNDHLEKMNLNCLDFQKQAASRNLIGCAPAR
jgi:hypothetical protein